MSIDAEISEVVYQADGTATLHLIARDDSVAPAGQSVLIVENPKPGMEVLVGEHLWGDAGRIMLKDRLFGTRRGYTRIRLPE